MKNIFAALIVGLFLILVMGLLVACDMNGTEMQAQYATANDGGYLPVYRVSAKAIRGTDYVEVEWNGNSYSAYISPESEIKTGDQITCLFSVYEGNVELIDIK